MKKASPIVCILALILTACATSRSGGSAAPFGETLPGESRTPLPTALPATEMSGHETEYAGNPVPAPPTPVPSTAVPVDLPIVPPSVEIGKGTPTSLAVSPDGERLAVSTQFGVHMYSAGSFEQLWFTSLPEKPTLVIFDGKSKRVGVAAGSGVVILDAAIGDWIITIKGAGDSFAW
jgi:hypothetical protein